VSEVGRGLIGLVVLLMVAVVVTWTAPTASADVPPDLVSSVSAVQAGTATPAQTEVYDSYVVWVEHSYGVSDDELSFQNIEQPDGTYALWSDDPVVANLDAAYNAAPGGGGTELATGSDLLGAAEDIGAAGPVETLLGGICASTVGCGLVGAGVAATIVLGPKVMSIFFPSANQALANDASSGVCPSGTSGNLRNGCGLNSPVQVRRYWCDKVGADSNGWTPVYVGSYFGGSIGYGCLNNDGTLTPSEWGGQIPSTYDGAMDINDSGAAPNCGESSFCVPTGDVQHGGVWIMAEQWPSGKWSFGSSGYAIGGDTSQCSPNTWNGYAFAWTVPPPGTPGATSGWDRIDSGADSGGSQSCYNVSGGYSTVDWAYGLAVMKANHAPIGFPRDGSCPSGKTCPSSPPPTTMPAVTPSEVASSLDSHPEVVQFFDGANGTTNPATGNSNLPGTVAVPAPSTGETRSQYQTDLSNAGFTNVQRQILTSDTADLDQPASAVTLVSPAPGQYADTATTITATTNPDSPNMPQATAREEDLATALENENPAVTNENKLKVARACLQYEDAATGNTDETGDSGDLSFHNCSTLPIFITGNDAQSAGQHDEIAVGTSGVTTNPSLTFSAAYGGIDPSWVLLSRDVTGKDDGWKESLEPCNETTPPDANCDEYPFLSSQQGGYGATPQPNLQYISGNQNQLQGTRLLQFYSAAQPTSQGINGCNITYSTEFLAVPIPDYEDLDTTWACNGRNDSP
jgi:hypothetical protein